MRRKVFPGTEISVTEIIFVADEHNFPAYNLQNVRHGKHYHIAFLHLNRTKLFDLSSGPFLTIYVGGGGGGGGGARTPHPLLWPPH